MKNFSDLRKAIKPLGYKIKTQSMSWGKAATYIHIETGEALSYSVADPEAWQKWEALNAFRLKHNDEIKQIQKNEGITGLKLPE